MSSGMNKMSTTPKCTIYPTYTQSFINVVVAESIIAMNKIYIWQLPKPPNLTSNNIYFTRDHKNSEHHNQWDEQFSVCMYRKCWCMEALQACEWDENKSQSQQQQLLKYLPPRRRRRW